MPRYCVIGGITYHQTVQADNAEEAYVTGQEEAVRGFCDYYGGSISEREVEVFEDVLDLDQKTEEGASLFVLTAVYNTQVTVEAVDEDAAEMKAYEAIAEELDRDLGLRGISHSDIAVWQVELTEEA